MNKGVRVRFAPSPTGHLHIGGLRTALFNWLFAKHHGGTFLLRIEDTDLERSKDEYTQAIYQAFAWVGIHTDEQPLIQSQRFSLYKEIAEDLISQEKAYRCACTPEQVEARARQAGVVGEYHGGYDGHCRFKEIEESQGTAIRFVIPEHTQTFAWNDAIRGIISFERSQLDDFVIIRSDGTPTYNFCVVIDDYASAITHVIRGEDHISNTPKQIALYQELDYALPVFAHIPMILGADGNKLSKRDGAVDVVAYRAMGYLPDALVNYIVRLGWAYGDQEVFTQEELIKYFTLEAVGKKPSVFDYTKLEWLNSLYMRSCTAEMLRDLIVATIDTAFLEKLAPWSLDEILKAVTLYKERTKNLVELANVIVALRHAPTEYIETDIAACTTSETPQHLTDIIDMMGAHSMVELHDCVKNYCKDKGFKLVAIAQPIRIALTGGATSPGIFDLLTLLGKEESIIRLQALQAKLSK